MSESLTDSRQFGIQTCFEGMFTFGDFNTGSMTCASSDVDMGGFGGVGGIGGVGYVVDDLLPPKRSANMTECVHVPSSEHVAEIVGRQGNLLKLGMNK